MPRSAFLVCLLLSAMICTPASAQERKPVLWISHRGESGSAPENTVKAFDLARISGSDGCECDARLTRDGKVVLSHDGSTKRMGGVALQIAEHTAEELRKVNVAGRFREKCGSAQIPYLQEVFPLVGEGRFLTIELKSNDPKLVTAIKELLPSSGLKPGQIEFCCFNKEVCRNAKTAFPEHRVLWVTSGKNGLTPEQALATLRKTQADGISISWEAPLLTKEAVQKFHDHGYLVLAWTVDTLDVARRMIDLGVDIITSNCAGKLKKELNDGDVPPPLRLDPSKTVPDAKITLQPGQVLELSMKSNPTTGYDWQVFLPETDTIVRCSRDYISDDKEGKLCGAGGTTILRFRAKKPGRTNLIGCNLRNWEALVLKDAQTFVLHVEIADPARH